jgi:hypothetical protein
MPSNSATKEQISKPKKSLVTQVPKKRNEPLTSIPGNKVPVDTSSEHPKVVVPPGSSGRESEVLLSGRTFSLVPYFGWGESSLHVSLFNVMLFGGFSNCLDEKCRVSFSV